MINELVEQVRHLMQYQSIKKVLGNKNSSNYAWISYKRSVSNLNTKDEFTIRQMACKLTLHQCHDVIKQLTTWIIHNPNAEPKEIPKICIDFLNKQHTMAVVQIVTSRRVKNSKHFLNSLKNITPNIILVFLNKFKNRDNYIEN